MAQAMFPDHSPTWTQFSLDASIQTQTQLIIACIQNHILEDKASYFAETLRRSGVS